MPIIKSAIKKLRKDRKRTKVNKLRKETLKKLIKEAVKSQSKTGSALTEKSKAKIIKAVSFVDKMAKVHLIHKNKASRLKSKLSSLVSKPSFASKSKAASFKSRPSKLVSLKSAKKVKAPAKPL